MRIRYLSRCTMLGLGHATILLFKATGLSMEMVNVGKTMDSVTIYAKS